MSYFWRFLSICAVSVALIGPAFAKSPKLKAEDVVARHLDALGTASSRAAVQTRAIEGRSRMKFEAGATGAAAQGLAAGGARIISGGSRYSVALPFDYSDYWGEQFVNDGTKVNVAFSYIQQRSPLGDFLTFRLTERTPIK